jgi:hypothetical protein
MVDFEVQRQGASPIHEGNTHKGRRLPLNNLFLFTCRIGGRSVGSQREARHAARRVLSQLCALSFK